MSNVIVAQTINQALKKDVITWGTWAWMNWPLLGVLVIIYYWTTWIMKAKNIEVPGGMEVIKRQKGQLSKMSMTEWVVLICFGLAILLWATPKNSPFEYGSCYVRCGYFIIHTRSDEPFLEESTGEHNIWNLAYAMWVSFLGFSL